MPAPATAQAIIAPRAPVVRPNAAGTAKMPEPIMEPTTREISDGRDSFWLGVDSMTPRGWDWARRPPEWGPLVIALVPVASPGGLHRRQKSRTRDAAGG